MHSIALHESSQHRLAAIVGQLTRQCTWQNLRLLGCSSLVLKYVQECQEHEGSIVHQDALKVCAESNINLCLDRREGFALGTKQQNMSVRWGCHLA